MTTPPTPRTAAGRALAKMMSDWDGRVDEHNAEVAAIEAEAASPSAGTAPNGVMESCTRWHRGGTEHFHYHPILAEPDE